MNKELGSNLEFYTKQPVGFKKLYSEIRKNRALYLLVLPVIIYYIVFQYVPMYGAIIAFKDFIPSKGIIGSPWAGFKHFQAFFDSVYFFRVLKNTVVISVTSIVCGFPAPIILALFMNELRLKKFSKIVQTVTYLPHFISLVVICGIIKEFVADKGVITYFYTMVTGQSVNLLTEAKYFVTIFVSSDVWQGVGWGSIIYLAALAGIDQELYEAAGIDGANRWKQALNITIPCIMPTIIIMLILRLGGILNVGFEKIILLYNPVIYETSDVISSFVYRKGLQEFNFSFSAAVGLFNSVINFAFLIAANWLSKKYSSTSLW